MTETPTWTCHLCSDPVLRTATAMFKHLSLIHPTAATLDRWPDGQLVFVDTTIEPGDFGGDQ